MGTEFNEDLPLYSQLYILKQIMGFYHMAQAVSFLPVTGLNFSFQVAYYLLRNRFMYQKSVSLFSFPRVLLCYAFIHVCHEEVFIKRYFMHTYRVNLNDLFDQDETFLFENLSFRRLIKRT